MAVTQSELDHKTSRVHRPHAGESSASEQSLTRKQTKRRRAWLVPFILIMGIVPLVLAWRMLMSEGVAASDTLVYYTVQRGSLPITVTERGNLESQNTEEITCEVESFGGDRSGVSGTQILYIIPNGSSVKKGDLLVELDRAPLRERLDSQFLGLLRAKASKTQAISKYENQKIQNETNLTKAKLQLDLAKCDLEHYCDRQQYEQQAVAPEGGMGGLFEIELQNVELRIQTQLAEQMISKENLDAIELLHKLGFRNRGELDEAKVNLLESQSQLATAIAEKRELEKYTFTKEMLSREEAVATARNNLEQVKRNNESELQQAEAARDSAIRAYDKEKERYERYLKQLEQCKIHAPQDGMVAYAVERGRGGSRTVIEKGAFVRERQDLLTLPDLSRMQVETSVHESVLDQVQKGLDAVIQVDAFPDRRYRGSVKSVAVLPDQGNWFSSDTKVYETVVTIDEDVRQLKPGMTAVVEIDIATLEDVISVPIQAVIQRGEANWCFVRKGGKLERREIMLGRTNDKFVEVREGLDVGEVVVLNPSDLMEERETAAEEAQGKTAKKKARKKPGDTPSSRSNTKKAKTGQASGESAKTGAANDAEPRKARKPPVD